MTFSNPSRRAAFPLPSRSSDHRPGRGGPFTVITTIRSEDQLRAALRKPHVFYAPRERRSLGDVVRGVVVMVYVVSSWWNPYQPSVVKALRAGGHHVYDLRHPEPGDNGFHWSQIDPEWEKWDADSYIDALTHPVAVDGFGKDKATGLGHA